MRENEITPGEYRVESLAAGSTRLYRHGRTTLQTNDYKVQRDKSKDRTHIRFSEAA